MGSNHISGSQTKSGQQAVTTCIGSMKQRMVLNLGAGRRKIHQASLREAVKGPESGYTEDSGSSPGEIGAIRSGRITDLVVKQNLTLPVVGSDTENRIGEEQDRNFRLRLVHEALERRRKQE